MKLITNVLLKFEQIHLTCAQIRMITTLNRCTLARWSTEGTLLCSINVPRKVSLMPANNNSRFISLDSLQAWEWRFASLTSTWACTTIRKHFEIESEAALIERKTFLVRRIIGWAVYYFFASFSYELPWEKCGNPWNTDSCLSVDTPTNFTNTTSPAREYFE